MNVSEFVDSYLRTLPTSQDGDEKLFLVTLIGLPGSGKSTFANLLGEKLGVYVSSNDKVRRWLNDQGIDGVNPRQELIRAIGEARERYLLDHGISHIMDADNIKFQDLSEEITGSYGAKLFKFYIYAPEKVILDRLELRKEQIEKEPHIQMSRAGLAEYTERKELHEILGIPKDADLAIDTTKPIDLEVEKAFELIQSVIEEK